MGRNSAQSVTLCRDERRNAERDVTRKQPPHFAFLFFGMKPNDFFAPVSPDYSIDIERLVDCFKCLSVKTLRNSAIAVGAASTLLTGPLTQSDN